MVFVLCPFIAMSRLLHYCLCVSLELLSKGGCVQCFGAKKDNLQWNLYYNWLQTTFFQVLFSSFGELDSSIFDTHDLHNMTPQQIELHPCSDSTRYEADERIPYVSLAFLDLQSKYHSSLPTDALQLVMAYDLAKQSFSGNNLEAWTGSVLKQMAL